MDDGTQGTDWVTGLELGLNGITGGLFTPLLLSNAPATVSTVSSVVSSPVAAISSIASGASDAASSVADGASSVISALTPSKSTLVLVVIGLIALWLILGKVETL